MTLLRPPRATAARVGPAFKRFLKILVAVALLVPIGGVLESLKLIHELEPAFLNSDIGRRKPLNVQRICRVVISRADYVSRFKGESPLDPDELGNVIEAMANQHPAVIVVDFDISSPRFAGLRTRTAQWPVVWTRNSVHSEFCHQDWPGRAFGDDGPVTPDQGLGVLPGDDDGLIRRYSRLVVANGPPKEGEVCPPKEVPSISWAALKRADLAQGIQPSTRPLLIRFELPLRKNEVPLSFFSTVGDLMAPGPPVSAAAAPLKGKIVLFGGYYDPSDEHPTPVGLMFGIDIIAQIIGTELDGGGREPVSPLHGNLFQMFGLAFVSALTLWLVMSKLKDKPLKVIVPLGGLIAVAFSLICSLLLTGSRRSTVSFLVVLLAVLGNRLFNDFKHKREQKNNPAPSPNP